MAEKRYEHRKQIKSVRWLIFWVVLAQLAADIAVQAVVSFMSNPPHEYIQIAISELIAIGIPIGVYGRSMWHGSVSDIKCELMMTSCNPGLLAIAAAIGISGQFVMMLLNIPANIFIFDVLGREATDAIPVAFEVHELFIGMVAVVIIPAILEEFWLRGLVFRAYNKCNTGVAIVYTTVVFALMHMRMNELCGFLFMGFVSVMILLRTRSLYAAMIYHGFSNFTALLFGFVLPDILTQLWVIFAAAVLFFGISVFLLFAATKPAERVRLFKGAEMFWKSIFSLPMLLSVCVVILRHFIVS